MRDKLGRFMKGHPKSKDAGSFKKGHPCCNTGRTYFKKGHKVSKEVKEKISLAHKGKKVSEKTKEKISKALKGRKFTTEHREKISKSSKGRMGHLAWNKNIPCPKKVKEKISESLYGRFRGSKSPNWKGGKRYDGVGYVIIYKPNHPSAMGGGYVYEHRLVVEKLIKRYLKPRETIHHINKKRNDNRPENLMAFVNHGIHNKFAKNKFIHSSSIIFDGRK